MLRRSLLRAARFPQHTHGTSRGLRTPPIFSTKPPQQAKVTRRFDRLVQRSPRFLRPALAGLQQAPVSHIVAFFALHEITAVLPLLGLAAGFHYYHWLPSYFAQGEWIDTGVKKFGRYFKQKGWISDKDENEVEQVTKEGQAESFEKQEGHVEKWTRRTDKQDENEIEQETKEGRPRLFAKQRDRMKASFSGTENAKRWIVEISTAYAIVKVLLPARIAVSVWAAPWVAREVFIPLAKLGTRVLQMSKRRVK